MSETCCTENLNYVLYDGALMDQQGNMFGVKTRFHQAILFS